MVGILRYSIVATALLLASTLLAGCSGGSGALIGSATADRDRITPNGDYIEDTAAIAYSLSRSARVSLYLLATDNMRYPLREDVRRPAGAYELPFDGTIATGQAEERKVVPAGEYRFVVEAVDDAGRKEQRDGRIVVADPDRDPPAMDAVVANPPAISPYDPGLQTETRISYRLAEPATVTLFVVSPDGLRTRVSEPLRQEPGEYAQLWNGLVRNKIPADGEYTCIVQAKDAAGNVAERGTKVSVSGTEEPDASIVRVVFSPQKVIKGDLVKVSITVRNTGKVTLRSHGPESGFTYTTQQTYASVEGGRYTDKANYWRVGVDWAGGLGAEGARYPYRWSLGDELAPGQEVTVEGYIRVLEDGPTMRFYAGLVHEKVKYHVDKVGQQAIEVSK